MVLAEVRMWSIPVHRCIPWTTVPLVSVPGGGGGVVERCETGQSCVAHSTRRAGSANA